MKLFSSHHQMFHKQNGFWLIASQPSLETKSMATISHPLGPTHYSDATEMQPDSHPLIQLQTRGPGSIKYVKICVNRNGLTSFRL